MSTFFISDLHLNHTSMALIHRGFQSIEDHNEFIIKQWNSVVNKKDTIYVCGDLTMEKKSGYQLFTRLKGVKNVVLGNHDRRQDVPELLKYVNSVAGIIKYEEFWLTHCPIHESELHGRYNISGHDHEGSLWATYKDYRYFNVSCESLNYTPISLEQIRAEIEKRKLLSRVTLL